MYAGQIVDVGKVDEIFFDSRHPYTWALLQSLPQLAMPIVTIGVVSSVMSLLAFGLGIYGGRKVAGRLHPEVLGGLILIGIGVKILIEHLTA